MNNIMSHTSAFRTRRLMNWLPLGLTYATFYMGRYNMHVANSTIRETFGFDKTEFGLVMTAGFWTYALSVIINGPLSDKIGGKKAIIFGAFGAAFFNLLIGLLFLNNVTTHLIVALSFLYAANSYFQSFGALSVVKVNAPWFHVRERGVFGGIFGSMISAGYWLAMGVGGWIIAKMPWYMVFIIPAIAMVVMAVIDMLMVADTPKLAGFEDIDTGSKIDAHDAAQAQDEKLDYFHLLKNVFKNRIIVTLMAAEFCTGFVRQGVLAWFTPFLKEVHHVDPGTYWHEFASAGITVGGIIGGIICGIISDKLFHSRRTPVAFFYYLMQIVSLLAMNFVQSAAMASFLVGFSCAWIFGVHGMLTGTASMDFGGKKAASTVAGILDGVQYIAAGFTGFGLGFILEQYGWGVWTWCLVPFSLMGAFLMLSIWNASPLKNPTQKTVGSQSVAPPMKDQLA